MKRRFQLVAALFATSLCTVASAQQMPPPTGMPMPGAMAPHGAPGMPAMFPHPPMPPHLFMAPPLPPELRLSEAQQDKVFEIQHAGAPVMRDQMKIARQAAEELHKLSATDAFDEAAVRAVSARLGQAMTELHVLRIRQQRQIEAVLTPEQRKQLADEKKKQFEMRDLPHHPARFADRQMACDRAPEKTGKASR